MRRFGDENVETIAMVMRMRRLERFGHVKKIGNNKTSEQLLKLK